MYERKIKLSEDTNIIFETDEDNEVGKQLIESFNKAVPSLPPNFEKIDDNLYWRSALENDIGNRNCTYILDNIWDNIVTPVETSILEARGYPITIKEIVKYICDEIVKGRIDDWNSVDNLRIRTGELFVALLQKQIHAAYNEYVAKVLGGDKEAKIFINPTAVFSEIINSQNVQSLENINPIEELSMMTRITPVGTGGVQKSEAWPKSAMNIHRTYYGNIDPLETPDSEKVGIVQHLAIGSGITNVRGLFATKDTDQVKPSEILSIGPSLIPFVESNDGIRVIMASGQSKQAIPLLDPENPAIQSGFESIYTPLLSDSFIKKSPVEGVVTEVNDQHILIKGNEKITIISVKPALIKSGQGKNGLSVFKPVVTVGDKVIVDQIVAEGSNIKNGIISNGLNMLIAFMPWKGYNFEDGMVISESAAKRFSSVHLESQRVLLDPDQDVSFISKLGDEVKKGDVLITYSSTLYDVETLNHLRADGGKIVNLEIYSNIPEEEIPEALRESYDAFKHEYTLSFGKYPFGQFKENKKKFEGILIKFTIQQQLALQKGDKLNNRHFNKGVVAVIEKDEDMPQTPWGDSVDMVYSPLSVINRMNPGQLMEMHTGLISRHLSMEMSKQSRAAFIGLVDKVLELLDGSDNHLYKKNTITYLKAINDTDYKKLAKQVLDDRFFPLIFPPFKSPPRKNIIDALDMLGLKTMYPLTLKEYNVTTQPVGIGYLYVVKLEHQSEKKIHARSTGPYNSTLLTPSAGKRRGGGQQLGEYDLYSLLAWDSKIVIDEMFGPMSSDHKVKNELIAEIVQTGNTGFRAPNVNPVREFFSQYMTAIHLNSE